MTYQGNGPILPERRWTRAEKSVVGSDHDVFPVRDIPAPQTRIGSLHDPTKEVLS